MWFRESREIRVLGGFDDACWQSMRLSASRFFLRTPMIVQFGPSHPAAHGVLRIQLMLLSEVIAELDIHFGLLHRGSEKLCEFRC
jgi:NADH:ubiquinone oxidoreductase subunit D